MILSMASALVVSCSPAAPHAPAERAAARDGGAAPSSAQANSAVDLQAEFGREATGLTKHAVDVDDWEADILAIAPPVVKRQENLWNVSVDIGSRRKIECFVYESMIDPGQTLGAFLKLLSSDGVEAKRIAVSDLKIVRETPVLFAAGVYTVATPKGRAAGMLKVAAQAHETHPVACVHDELGYSQSFASVLESLVVSLRGLTEPAEPKFVEITRVDVGDTIVGFSFGNLRSAPSGGSEWFEQSTQIFPRSATDLMITDSAHVEKIDAAGRLIGGTWSEAESGEIVSTVTLSRKPTGKYAYEGTIQNKPVAGEFDVKSKAGLTSIISDARLLAGAMKKKQPFDVTADFYVPKIDPTKATQTRYKGLGSGEVTALLKDRTVVEKLSPDGHTESWELAANGVKITGRRIFTKGSLFGKGSH